MKKIIFIISLITLFSCSEDTYILEPTLPLEDIEAENPFKDCFNIVSMDTNNPNCGKQLSVEVVTNDFFNKGIQSSPNDRRLVCITNKKYVFNDFNLGQTLCDLSIYN